MAKEEKKYKITQEQGNLLLSSARNFAMPEKLGDASNTPIDRSLADKEVGELYLELKSRSPILQSKKQMLFGPADNWNEVKENNQSFQILKDTDKEVEIKLTENSHSGAYWCLVLMLHPGSKTCMPAGIQQDILWPLVDRLRIRSAVEKQIGLDKAQHKRLDLDPDPEEVEETKEEPEAPEHELEEAEASSH